MRSPLGADDRAWWIGRGLAGAGRGALGRDLLAGLTLAAIAVPEQMATARLAGLEPKAGLVAFVAATIGFAVFGANRILSSGADSTIAPIFAGGLALLAAAGSPQYAALAAMLALTVGVILVFASLLRLGWIADLLSRPVMVGFLAGIAAHILIAQAPAALGLAQGAGSVFQRLATLSSEAPRTNWICAAIALFVFGATIGAERLSPRAPGALLALAAATAASAALRLSAHGVPVLGALTPGLPTLAWPQVSPQALASLVGLAAIVAIVVMVQSATTTRSFGASDAGPDLDRDFLGLGTGGVLAGLFGAFPVNASPPRTAAVAAAGGQSQVGGLCAALAVLALAALGGDLLAEAPTAALAGVLFYIAQRIIHWGEFADLARRAPAELALALATTTLIFVLPIQTGVALGVFLSLAHGVYTITRARPTPYERIPGTTVWWPLTPERRGETLSDVLVMGFQAPLVFLNADQFRRSVDLAVAAAGGPVRLFVLEASNIVDIDVTAADVLTAVIHRLRTSGVDVALARLESVTAHRDLERLGVIDALGRDHLFPTVAEAIETLRSRPSDSPAAGAPRSSPDG